MAENRETTADSTIEKYQHLDGVTYDRVNDFVRDRVYLSGPREQVEVQANVPPRQ